MSYRLWSVKSETIKIALFISLICSNLFEWSGRLAALNKLIFVDIHISTVEPTVSCEWNAMCDDAMLI